MVRGWEGAPRTWTGQTSIVTRAVTAVGRWTGRTTVVATLTVRARTGAKATKGKGAGRTSPHRGIGAGRTSPHRGRGAGPWVHQKSEVGMFEVRDQDVLKGAVEGADNSGGTEHSVLLGFKFHIQGVLYWHFTRVVLALTGTGVPVDCWNIRYTLTVTTSSS